MIIIPSIVANNPPVTFIATGGLNAMPTGYLAGDFLFAVTRSSGYDPTPNAGWTLITRSVNYNVRIDFWTRIATGSDIRPTVNGDNWCVGAFRNGKSIGASAVVQQPSGDYVPQVTLQDNSGNSAVILGGRNLGGGNTTTFWTDLAPGHGLMYVLKNTKVSLTPYSESLYANCAVFEIKNA